MRTPKARTQRPALAGKVAFVTGAGRGIGRATAFALAQAGADVALLDVDSAAARAAAREVKEATDGRTLAVKADVTKWPQVQRAVERVVTHFGRLDILVNNAGIWEFGHLADVKEDDWDRVFAVNLKGVLLCTQAVLPVMRKQGSGKIVNIASGAGLGPAPAWSAYCISKSAVIMLSRIAAEELKPDSIQVHCLCPGAVDTDLARRITALTGQEFPHAMDATQVAEAVVDLLTPFRSRKTGRVVVLYRGGREEVKW
jgi:meso-butanediol dehydrogenase/(S,S)-butanediol dehydrogenase/diacetyl reductase